MLYNEHEALTAAGREIEIKIDEFVTELIEKHPGIPIRQLVHVVVECALRNERKAVIAKELGRRSRERTGGSAT